MNEGLFLSQHEYAEMMYEREEECSDMELEQLWEEEQLILNTEMNKMIGMPEYQSEDNDDLPF